MFTFMTTRLISNKIGVILYKCCRYKIHMSRPLIRPDNGVCVGGTGYCRFLFLDNWKN